MEIFKELLRCAQELYETGKYDNALETLQAAVKYLRGLLDAKKQISQKT